MKCINCGCDNYQKPFFMEYKGQIVTKENLTPDLAVEIINSIAAAADFRKYEKSFDLGKKLQQPENKTGE